MPGSCFEWEHFWQAYIDRVRPAVSVILLGRWEMLDRQVDGQWQHLGQRTFDTYLADRLDRAIAIAGSQGATVIVCTTPYFSGAERPQGGAWPENDPRRVDRFNQLVRAAVSRHPAVTLFDLHGLVSPGGHFASVINGRAVRSSDGVHFSPEGGALVGAHLFPRIVASAHAGPSR
jgi:hypothetical protein